MKITVIYTIIVFIILALGMIMDVFGLWFSIKYYKKKSVFKSKLFYRMMNIGEILEHIAREGLIFLPILFIIELLKIF